MLVQIKSPYFTAGLLFEESKAGRLFVKESAPILKYMKGWLLEKVETYCKRKNWDILKTELKNEKTGDN